MNNKGKIVVLYSASGLPESAISAKSSDKVSDALKTLGYKVDKIAFSQNYLSQIQNSAPQAVFNCIHGVLGEDGSISGALNSIGIPYTHSGVLASAICFNKLFSYKFFSSQNVRMPNTFVAIKEDILNKKLPLLYPFILKPISQGSSIGVSLINNHQDLGSYNFENEKNLLVQEYIKGKELQVAVLDGKSLGVLEVKPLNRPIFDYYAKYTQGAAEYIMPTTVDNKVINELMSISEQVYKLSHCRSICRIEFIVNDANEIFLLEINTNPGLTQLSICPMISNYYNGISFIDLVEMILKLACVD